MVKKLLMALQFCLLVFGLVTGLAGGWIYWGTISNGIPEIVDLRTLHTTKAKYAHITASLKDTGIYMPRDKKNSPSYFYTIELEDKQVLVKSLHKREKEPVSTFYVRVHPYEDSHTDAYFAFLAAARSISVDDVRDAYADKMLQYFDHNPKTYGQVLMIAGMIVFAAGVIWTAASKNGKELLRSIFSLKKDAV
jgi:hypothetical protein